MKKLLLLCLMFVLVSCWIWTEEWKFDKLSEDLQYKINQSFVKYTISSNWMPENFTELTEDEKWKAFNDMKNKNWENLEKFKLEYKNIDFSNSQLFAGRCSLHDWEQIKWEWIPCIK